MARSVRRWALAITLAGGSLAAAQPWPAVTPVQGSPPPAPRFDQNPSSDDPLYVIRTAGQADRIVRVIHPTKDADGLAEVKDTATGQTFNIPGKVLAKLPRANATKPDTAPAPPTGSKPELQPAKTPADPLPNLPTSAVRPAKLETVEPPAPQPVTITPPPGEKMVVTWRADDPPALAPAKPVPTTPTPPDVWRASPTERPALPSVQPPAPTAPGPRVTPAPTWKPTRPPVPNIDPNDPWRPSRG
jgi:hypothetical protein